MLPNLIAFTGFAGAGKDEAAKAFLDLGYERHNFGDLIKCEVDPLVVKYFGFSAFTEDRALKPLIRRTLEAWGEDRYDAILKRFLDTLPVEAVNTRLCRVKEAVEWRARGGIILYVDRLGVSAATAWERDRMNELWDERLIDGQIRNWGSLSELRNVTLSVAESVYAKKNREFQTAAVRDAGNTSRVRCGVAETSPHSP